MDIHDLINASRVPDALFCVYHRVEREPHPGRLLNSSMATPVTPDLIVEEVEGELVLMLNDRTVPSLRISRAYARRLLGGRIQNSGR